MSSVEVIHEYYRCFRERNRQRLREILTPTFKHVSPFGQYDDRDQMLDDIWPHVGGTYGIDIRVFGEGPEYMVRYRHAGNSSGRLAEWIRFEGESIAAIEVYLGDGAVTRLPSTP